MLWGLTSKTSSAREMPAFVMPYKVKVMPQKGEIKYLCLMLIRVSHSASMYSELGMKQLCKL